MFFRMNKFNRTRTADGFDSKLEKAVHSMLLNRMMADEITDIRRQHCVHLTKANIACKIDFSYVEKASGQLCFVEAKGFVTDRWRIIKKLWLHYGQGPLEIYTGTYHKPTLEETIVPKGAGEQ